MGTKETILIVVLVLVLFRPNNHGQSSCIGSMDFLVGFALLFPLSMIILGLDVRVLVCIPRDPSVAWQS